MARRPTNPRDAAEAAFKAATTKPPERTREAPAIPGRREQISLRVDAEVIEWFQDDGPGWQDRMADALRKAAGK
ncbi:BrnA antitoxin family protein [Aureimonas sp. ME7]|uniref:BrnA antitoxin family protein n=1 Tax=Aureimonas sp. ME7 TaxID=2744252 RepID=UPI0015F4C178|nr:BrnA antitoxin family protein [Aureimonas sp. ME7]